MKIGKHKLLFYSLANDVLDKLLDPRDVLQHMLVGLPELALDEDVRQEALPHGERFRPVCVICVWIARRTATRAPSRGGTIRIEVIEHAEMDAPAALIRHGKLTIEDEPSDREPDRERHEQRGGVVNAQGRRERQPQVRVP